MVDLILFKARTFHAIKIPFLLYRRDVPLMISSHSSIIVGICLLRVLGHLLRLGVIELLFGMRSSVV